MQYNRVSRSLQVSHVLFTDVLLCPLPVSPVAARELLTAAELTHTEETTSLLVVLPSGVREPFEAPCSSLGRLALLITKLAKARIPRPIAGKKGYKTVCLIGPRMGQFLPSQITTWQTSGYLKEMEPETEEWMLAAPM